MAISVSLRLCSYLYWRALSDFIRRPADHPIARFQIPDHFHEISIGHALFDVDPFRLAALVTYRERALGGGDHARFGHEQRRPQAAHWPLHRRIHTRGQGSIAIYNVQLNGRSEERRVGKECRSRW